MVGIGTAFLYAKIHIPLKVKTQLQHNMFSLILLSKVEHLVEIEYLFLCLNFFNIIFVIKI